jgi:nitrate/nitrite transport system ATP-binding protein
MRGYVELYNLGKTYPTRKGPAVVVQKFDLNVAEGEFVALLGHSGCGKSTVLTMVAGLNAITEGGIAVAHREIRGPGPDRGVVFQAPCLMPWLTALENVRLGVDRVYPKATAKERRDLAEYVLGVVGLEDAMHKRPRELSLGMQQRVGIARAPALSPKVLLLDEPFGMLDSLTRMELQEVLLELIEADRLTTLMVTHDVDEALFLADRIVMMTSGPAARVGQIIAVPFARPRKRSDVLGHPDYYTIRQQMIAFLEEHERPRGSEPGGPGEEMDATQPSLPRLDEGATA